MRRIFLCTLMVLFSISFYSLLAQEKEQEPEKKSEYTDLYEDENTGQIFTKPGPNRVKTQKVPKGFTDKTGQEVKLPQKFEVTSPPDGYAHRPDDVSKEKLTILGRIQYRGLSGSAQSPFSNGHRDFNAVDYNFRRLRIGAMYENDWWGTIIQLRLENMLNRPDIATQTSTLNYTDTTGKPASATYVSNVKIRDNRGYIQEAIGYVKLPYAGLRFTFGQINVPFNREYIGSSANLVSLERSMVTAALNQFDDGVMIQSTPLKEIAPKYERYLHLSLMVGNGRGGGGDYGTGRRQDLTAANRWNANSGAQIISPTYYGRAVFNVFGSLKRESDGKSVNWQEGEEIFQKDMKLSLGVAFQRTRNELVTAVSAIEYNAGTTNGIAFIAPQTTADYGNAITAYTNPSASAFQTTSVGAASATRPRLGLNANTFDGTFTWNGFYLNAAYTKMTGAASNQLKGYHATIGYNIPVGRYYFMPLFKYDWLNGDFKGTGNTKDPMDTLKIYWVGLNFFGDKHHYKVQLYYEILANKLNRDPNTGNPMFIDDRRVYLQVQANFWTGTVSPEAYNYRAN